jgi:DASH complex subunit ASK1
MTFHVPQRRLLRTPAKEASKRIVSDLLMSAGHGHVGNGDGEDEEFTDEVEIDEFDIDIDAEAYEMGEATSPSVVRGGRVEDESF